MADAGQTLRLAVDEAALLARTGGQVADIEPVIILARTALDALDRGETEVSDDEVRKSGIHPTKQNRLGVQ